MLHTECSKRNHPFLNCHIFKYLSHNVSLTRFVDRGDLDKYFDTKLTRFYNSQSVQNDFITLLKVIGIKYQIFTKLNQISHAHKNVFKDFLKVNLESWPNCSYSKNFITVTCSVSFFGICEDLHLIKVY